MKFDGGSRELRGIANYYALANDCKTKLARLFYIAHSSFFRTLAAKYKLRIKPITDRLNMGGYYAIQYTIKNTKKYRKLFKLKELKSPSNNHNVSNVDLIQEYHLGKNGTELIRRLNANQCEYCGQKDGYFEVHHIRRLKDIEKGAALWEKHMIARRRKTLILCIQCHDLLHKGTLPDWRYRNEDKVRWRA